MDSKIKKNIIMYNMVSNTISSIVLLTIITILLIVFKNKISDYIKIIKIGYIIIVLGCLFNIFIKPFISIKTWSYSITDKYVEYIDGMISTSKTVIPISRIQQVMIIKGPLLNAFGLVEAEILTTINTHKLKNITMSEGEEIVKEITEILYDKSKKKATNETVEDKQNEEK